jgi:hypothetical protein
LHQISPLFSHRYDLNYLFWVLQENCNNYRYDFDKFDLSFDMQSGLCHRGPAFRSDGC